MPFQKSVNNYPASAVAGDVAGLNPVAYLFPTPVAISTGVTVGAAVWLSATGVVAMTGTGAPAGIVTRVLTGILPSNLEATMTILGGQPVPVVTRGDIYINTGAAAVLGHKVFANLTTGVLTTAAAGSTVAGAVETTFTVRETGTAGEAFLVSNW